MKRLIIFLLSTFSVLFATAQKHVDIYRSGVFVRSYSTIDSAIKAAYSSDSLVLSAHTFYETKLNASSKVLTFKGTITSTDTTIIDGGGKRERILDVQSRSSIYDIIFQNAKRGVIRCDYGVPTDTVVIGGRTIIRNCSDTIGSPILAVHTLVLQDDVQIINDSLTGSLMTVAYFHFRDRVKIAYNFVRSSYTNVYLGTIRKGGIIYYPTVGIKITDKVAIVGNTTDSNITAGICIVNASALSVLYIGDSVRISENRVLTPGIAKGGAFHITYAYSSVAGTLKSFKLGAAIFENNEAEEGGAIYCSDSSIKLEFNGTVFRNNKAKRGGAIYTRGQMTINDANFEDNTADTAASIYLNNAPEIGGTTPFISVTRSRFFNKALPSNKQNHVFATYSPLTAMPPSITFEGNWWGKSDTIGVMTDKPKGTFPIYSWAKANWSVKGGVPVVASDTSFPLAATISSSMGTAFPASSFAVLKGYFKTDTGSFSPLIAAINSSNVVSSTYRTFKDSASKTATAHFTAWIDADTFRKSVLVWAKDTLPAKGAIAGSVLPQVQLYPNPATDQLYIEGADAATMLRLLDELGREVIPARPVSDGVLHLGDIAPGLYILELRTSDGHIGSVRIERSR